MTSQVDSATPGTLAHPHCLIARFTAHPSTVVAFLEALREVRSIALNEPGTEAFAVHRASEDPLVIWVYERYSSQAAYQTHRQGITGAGLEARIRPYVADREVFHLALDWAK